MGEILYGLDISEFRHPMDVAATNAVEKVIILNKLAEAVEEFTSKYNDRIDYLGAFIRLNRHNAPHIMELVDKVKEILDYEGDIEVFSHRSYSYRINIGGISRPVMMIPDAAIRKLSDKMLEFLFGQAVTMIKGRMLKMLCLSKEIGHLANFVPGLGNLLDIPLGQWNRKVQLTIDRGGLLACQDYKAAMNYMTILSGYPVKEDEDIDIATRIGQIVDLKNKDKGIAAKYGQVKNTVFSDRRAWANERFVEMYNWVESGEYGRIIMNHT